MSVLGFFTCAWTAGPPTPAFPGVPFPAMVVIVPVASTLRMRWLALSAM